MKWKAPVKNAIKQSALQYLTSENSLLQNTKDISFDELKPSEYLLDNRNTSLTKIIFSLISKTVDIKYWQPWNYFDNLCVACEIKKETMNHFLTCTAYENIPCENNWEQVKENDVERQFEIAQRVKLRQKARQKIIDHYEAGHPPNPTGSRAPVIC